MLAHGTLHPFQGCKFSNMEGAQVTYPLVRTKHTRYTESFLTTHKWIITSQDQLNYIHSHNNVDQLNNVPVPGTSPSISCRDPTSVDSDRSRLLSC